MTTETINQPETSPSVDGDCSTDESLCCDVIDDSTINRWFDYWVVQDKKHAARPHHVKEEFINRIRRLALAGASKARKNNKAVATVLAIVLDQMARDLRSGNGKIVVNQ